MTETDLREIALHARTARQQGDFAEAAKLWGHLAEVEPVAEFKRYAEAQQARCLQFSWERNGL